MTPGIAAAILVFIIVGSFVFKSYQLIRWVAFATLWQLFIPVRDPEFDLPLLVVAFALCEFAFFYSKKILIKT